MAEKNVSVRFSAKDIGAVLAALKQYGDEGDAAFKKVKKASDDAGNGTESLGRKIEALRNRIDPTYRAAQQLTKDLKLLEDAQKSKAISDVEAAERIHQTKLRYDELYAANARLKASIQTNGFSNLGAALTQAASAATRFGGAAGVSFTNLEILKSGAINTFQTLAAGGNVFDTLITQATQTAPAFLGAGNAIGFVKNAFISFLPQIALATGALGAAIGIYALLEDRLTNTKNAQAIYNDQLARASELQKQLAPQQKASIDALERERSSLVSLARARADDAQAAADAAAKKATVAGPNFARGQPLTGAVAAGQAQAAADKAAVQASQFAVASGLYDNFGTSASSRNASTSSSLAGPALSAETLKAQALAEVQARAAVIASREARERYIAVETKRIELMGSGLPIAEREAQIALAGAQVDAQRTAALTDLNVQQRLAVEAQQRLTDAAGKGEAAQRRATIENQVATAASISAAQAASTRASLEAQELLKVQEIRKDTIAELQRQTDADNALAAAQAQGGTAVEQARVAEQAKTLALKEGAEGTEAYTAALKAYTEALTGAAAASDRLSLSTDIANQQRQIDLTKFQLSTLGMNDNDRAAAIADYKAQQDLQQRGIDLGSTEAQTYLENARNLGVYTKQLSLAEERQRDIRQAANDATRTIAQGFEDAIVNGKKFSDVLQGVYQDLVRIATRLLITKPFENWLTGGSSGGGGGGGGLMSLFGGGGGGGFGGGMPMVGQASYGGSWLNPDTGSYVPNQWSTVGSYSGGGGGFDFGSVFSSPGSFFGGFFADGGDISPGKMYMVGEQGPEMFVPRTAGTIMPANDTARMLNGRGDGGQMVNVYQTITTPNADSFYRSQTQLVNRFRSIVRAA